MSDVGQDVEKDKTVKGSLSACQKFMMTSTEFAMKFFRSEITPPLFKDFSGNS